MMQTISAIDWKGFLATMKSTMKIVGTESQYVLWLQLLSMHVIYFYYRIQACFKKIKLLSSINNIKFYIYLEALNLIQYKK
jgi:hypothetical protein